MALGDLFAQAKRKASKLYNQFFFDEEAPAPDMQRREAYPPQGQQPYPQGDASYQQPQVQAAYQQQPAYQQPYQAQAAYQQQPYPPQQPQQPQFSAQYQPPQRNRRAQQRAAQPEDNVVPISAYQQAHQPQQAQQQPPQAPQQAYQQQPQMPPQQAQPQTQQPPAQASGAARIINARGIGDCRSAIMLLRAGDAVVIVMDNITDPAEMRRYVDTLSGACFSLSATITKVSRYGAYFLAPQGMAVYADQTTSQMNGASRAPARPAYPQQPYAQPQQPYAQTRPAQPPVNPYPPQRAEAYGDFAPRVAEAAPQQPFYAREAQQAPHTPFSEQPQGYGYAPDEYAEAAQN